VKRTPTTKDVGLLHQLHQAGQLILKPGFQRNSVWPDEARAYLIDTILNDRPIPLLFFQRGRSADSGKLTYYVIDGQQRLRAIFDFLEDEFRLIETKGRYRNKLHSELPQFVRDEISNYDLMVDELTGYSEKDMRDIFVRMNKYVVKAVPQEVRHAQRPGAFADFVNSLAANEFWKTNRIFTKKQRIRMRAAEFCAELAILLIEGPQDKKASVDLYYETYDKRFPRSARVKRLLSDYLDWISANIPGLNGCFLRKPVDFYALIGALREIYMRKGRLPRVDSEELAARISAFEAKLNEIPPSGEAARYVEAASRQTDNLRPRKTRIDVLKKLVLDRL